MKPDRKVLLEMYRKMMEIRLFEEKTMELAGRDLITGYLHPYLGEEAIAVGACFALEKDDYITSTHRGHGHCLAKGANPGRMMAELMAKETGYCKGRGGSMHIFSMAEGILGANGIVGGGIPIATGAALGSRVKRDSRVTICFFGEGAVNNGVFHESLNLASVWKLPVIFLCENNLYANSTPNKQASAVENVADRAGAYNMSRLIIDGNDVLEVYGTVKKAIDLARQGNGPSLIEALTYRWTGHHMNDPGAYRPNDEVEKWKRKEPIARFRKWLIIEEIVTEKELKKVTGEIEETIEKAAQYGIDSPEPSNETFLMNIKNY